MTTAWRGNEPAPGHNGAPGAAGGARGCIQRSKVSMMRMRPPQQGQGGSRCRFTQISETGRVKHSKVLPETRLFCGIQIGTGSPFLYT
jgi:hypothetical protein